VKKFGWAASFGSAPMVLAVDVVKENFVFFKLWTKGKKDCNSLEV